MRTRIALHDRPHAQGIALDTLEIASRAPGRLHLRTAHWMMPLWASEVAALRAALEAWEREQAPGPHPPGADSGATL